MEEEERIEKLRHGKKRNRSDVEASGMDRVDFSIVDIMATFKRQSDFCDKSEF